MTEDEIISEICDNSSPFGKTQDEQCWYAKKAIYDIIASIPGFAISDFTSGSFAVRAAIEQTEYLLVNKEKLMKRELKSGESVDGLSISFANIGLPEISPRAQIYIQRAKAAFNGAVLRVNRG